MPFYEYCCGSCSHQFDVLKKISDDPAEDCPECGKPAQKRISVPGSLRKSNELPSCGSREKRCAPSGGG